MLGRSNFGPVMMRRLVQNNLWQGPACVGDSTPSQTLYVSRGDVGGGFDVQLVVSAVPPPP